ncbi:hypothetical protein VSAL_p840_43 (plasmid) [Aliivibrio salmonicida LFI1238]|uniref:Uncharacterized protein n=2 Tax=Vibrionaceae TaxID=641 RepID=B6ET14_ALISL|nr:hypothetical protein VSAL_p840_43 [Aliivibrio salmonicida LFI1238]
MGVAISKGIIMPAFKVKYLNSKKELLHCESIFMKNIGAAKRSSSSMAPMNTESIEIYDVGEKWLATKELGKWKSIE